MFILSLFLISISSANYVNDTTPITINKNGESNYEIDVGAEGVVFTLVTTKMLSFKGVQSDKSKLINIILNFHDDDYHNTAFSLTTENVRITFACDDPIKFSLTSLTSVNTDFSSEKPIYANITTNSDLTFDYTSFVNGFGPGCTLSGSKIGDGLYSDFNSLLKVQLPDTVKEITFLDTSFKIELESGEKDTFSNVFNQNYQIVLLSNEDKDEVVIDAASPKILGNLTIIAKNAILNATDEFKQVTAASVPIKICCEIIVLPYDTVPTGIFEYINDKMEEKSDQVVMTNGIRSYCLYDKDDQKCDIYGTIPLKIDPSQFYVQTGKSMTYLLCTSTPPTIYITNTASSSLTINGTSTTNQAVIFNQDLSSVSDSITFSNLELQIYKGSQWNVKNMYIGSDVTFKGNGWQSFKFIVSESYNSSFSWYLNNLELTRIFSVEFMKGSKIILYDFNNIYSLFLGEDDCFKVQYDDDDESKVVKFPNDDNKIVIYTNDSYFSMDVQGNEYPYGNFELHVLLLDDLKDILRVDFPSDWKNVKEVEGGPIGLHIESLSRNNHIITMPFDQFPPNFVDFDEDKFTLYSTVNTTICLYNEGQDECSTVIGGQSLKIPTSGEIEIEEGTQYIYSADEKVKIPENLVFKFDKNSAKAVGFDFANYAKVKLVVTDEELEFLSLKKVNFTCEFSSSSSKQLKVKKYENYYSSFQLDGSFSVTESITISVVEFREFEDKNYAFSGNFMKIIDPGLITEIEFTEEDWTIEIENSGNPFRIDEKGMTLKIESASKNVTFDVTEGAKTLTTLDFTSTQSDSIIYFTTRWTDSSISIDSPVQLYNNVESLNVKFYHPFNYVDSESAKKLVNYAPKIEDCPYQNTSVCLSSDGSSDCSISGFHLKAKAGQGSVYNVPSGYRFKLLIADDDLKVSYDTKSAKNISIEAHGKDVRPIILSITNSMPTDTLLLMNDLQVTFETTLQSIEWKLSSLDLFDTTFNSPVTAKLAVSGNCSVEMDIFYKLTKEGDGVFSDGRLTVDGYITLRDSNEEYLNEIQLSSDSWTLKTSVCEFVVKNSQFKYLILGVNRPPQTNPRFVPLTLSESLINGQVAGNLDINIEEEYLYLQIGNEWTKVKSIVGGKIDIRATHNKGISRFLYDKNIDPQLFFNFHSSVHAINNATCPICLLPSENYVSDCFNNQALDMLPVITNEANFLLDENRTYIIYGSPEDVHDFKYRTDIEYSVSVIAANKVTVKMNNAPTNVDFYFDSLIDDDGECDLIFEKSMTLKSLRFDDSVRITANVDNFKLTLNELTIDYKGFRRFFREPGIFSKTNSIEVNGFINIIDDGRYDIIQCGSNYWNLIGNEDAWNTTLERRGSNQRLKITTSNTIINISSSIPSESSENSILSISFEFETASTILYIEPSIADIQSFIDGKCIIQSDQSLSIYSPFSYLPYDFFSLEGSYQSYSFKPTESVSFCLYEEGKEPCKVDGTKPQAVKSDKPFKIRFATKCSLVLTNTDVSLSFGETSSSSIDIKSQSSGSQKLKASLSFSSSVKTEKLSLDVDASSVDLAFTDANKNLSFNSIKLTNSMLESNSDCTVSGQFEGQFSSLQKFTKKLTTGNSINLEGDVDSFSKEVTSSGPTILIGQNTKVYLTNLGSIFCRFDIGYDTSINKNKVVFGTSSDDSKSNSFTFLNLPVSSKFDLDIKGAGSSVFSNWIGGTSDSSLLPIFCFKFEGSSNSLTVSKSSSESTNWPQPKSADLAQIQVVNSASELQLNVESMSFLKIDESKVKLDYKSLSNIGNINNACQNIELAVLLENVVKTVGVGSNKVQISDVAVPSSTIKKLTIVHQNSLNNLTVNRIDSSSTVSDLTIQMNGGTHLYMAKGFASASNGKITIEKVDGSDVKATVYILDSEKPSVLSCGDGVDVVVEGGGGDDDDDDSSDKNKKLKPGIIVAIVLLVVLVVAVICILIVYYIRSKKVDETNYDLIPPLLSSNTDNKNVDL